MSSTTSAARVRNDEHAHWDRVAGNDPQTMIRHGDWHTETPRDLAMLANIEARSWILDLGCGIGRLSVAFAETRGANVIGVDLSSAMLERAERHWRVSYVQGDGRTLPPLPELGGAFSVLMFQHIPPDVQASYVAQVARGLKPGARFVFQTVVGKEDVFLSHQVGADDPARWCEAAGLTVERVEHGESGWLWMSAVLDNRSGVR